MSFTEFYMQSTGNNVNAGSTNTDAATSTTTNGNWDSATGIFIAASGTPFASTNVGDWASIYIDGATVAVFIAQVTAVTSSTQITVSLTTKFGTAPTTSATTRSCKIGGAWANMAGIGTAMTSGTVPLATRINIKAGTYSHTTTTVSVAMAGTTTAPLWLRGYKTSIGDLATRPTTNRVEGTDIPLLSWTTSALTLSGAHVIVTDIAWTSARAATAFTHGATQVHKRCRYYNTNASSLATSISAGSTTKYYECLIQATTTATIAANANTSQMDNCVIIGGISAIAGLSTGAGGFRNCVIRGFTTNGVSVSTNQSARLQNCTIVGGTNGINFSATPGICEITDCLFSGCSTAGINNTSGTNTNLVTRVGNAFWNCGSAEVGFGDSPAFDSISEVADPLNGAADASLKSTALSKGAAGGLFEGESYSNYLDAGAVQRQEVISSTRSATGFVI